MNRSFSLLSIAALAISIIAPAQAQRSGKNPDLIGNAAGALNGAAGAVGGVVSGTLGSSAAGTLGGPGLTGDLAGKAAGSLSAGPFSRAGSASDPGGGIAGATWSALNLAGPEGSLGSSLMSNGALGSTSSAEASAASNANAFLRIGGSTAKAVALELQQRVIGRLQALGTNLVTVELLNGITKTFAIDPRLGHALAGFMGRNVYLRSVDGATISSVVGRSETLRGTVTAVSNDIVTFLSPSGEVHSIALAAGSAKKLGIRGGAPVLAASNDFGRTATLALLNVRPASALADVYVGKVVSANPSSVTLRLGTVTQTFATGPAVAAALRSLQARASAVALVTPDGTHAKALLTSATLNLLLAEARGRGAGGTTAATVVSQSSGRLVVQLPNGDLRTLGGNVASLRLRSGTNVTLVPLDRLHVRVQSQARAATLADVGLCATVNASCAAGGTVLFSTPSSAVISLANGDVVTLLGDDSALALHDGTHLTLTPLDRVHVRATANGRVADLVDADVCVTINSGCRSMPATIASSAGSGALITLADGTAVTLTGTGANLPAGSPAIVQPLDDTHVLVQAGSQVADLLNASACLTVNAVCVASAGSYSGQGLGGPSATVRGSGATRVAGSALRGDACATLNAPGCAAANNGTNAGNRHVPSAFAVAGAGANRAATNAGGSACATLNTPGCNGSGAGRAAGRGMLAAMAGNFRASSRGATGNAAAAGCTAVNNAGCRSTASTVSNSGNGGGLASPNGGPGAPNGAPGAVGAGSAGTNPNGTNGTGGNSDDANAHFSVLPDLGTAPSVVALLGTPSESAGSACKDDGQIIVTLTDTQGGRPLSNATIDLQGPLTMQWHTDQNGQARFVGLPAGSYRAIAAESGYGAQVVDLGSLDCTTAVAATVALEHLVAGKRQAPAPAPIVRHVAKMSRKSLRTLAVRHVVCASGPTPALRAAHAHTLRRWFGPKVICSK